MEVKSGGDTSGNKGTYSLGTAFAIATAFCIFVLFIFKNSIPYFWTIFYGVVPIILYIISSLLALASQMINCGNIDFGNAFLAGLGTPLSCLIFIGIASISWFRVPIASAFAPLLISEQFATLRNFGVINEANPTGPHLVDIRTGTLQALEAQSSAVEGISYAYYLLNAEATRRSGIPKYVYLGPEPPKVLYR